MRRKILLVDFISVLFIFEKFGKWQNDMRNGRNTTVDKFLGMVFLESAIKKNVKRRKRIAEDFSYTEIRSLCLKIIHFYLNLNPGHLGVYTSLFLKGRPVMKILPMICFVFYFKGIWILPFKRGFNLLGNSLKLTYQ